MERLVIRFGGNPAVPCKFDLDFAVDLDKKTWNGLKEIFDALADVYDILGDNYNLDRLREIVEADRDGRCVVLPCKVGEAVYQVDDGDIFDMTVESIQIDSDDPTDMSIFTDELTLDRTEREARAALKGKQNEV